MGKINDLQNQILVIVTTQAISPKALSRRLPKENIFLITVALFLLVFKEKVNITGPRGSRLISLGGYDE